nr:NAD-dependent epimerase/dehydratase family protein [uncultured Sphingobacterium sp.]
MKNYEKTIILGASGFIGQNLLTALPGSLSVSLRNNDWAEKLSSANIIVNLIGKAHDHGGVATEKDYYYVNTELVKVVFEAFINSSSNVLIHVSSLAAIEEFEATKPLLETDSSNSVSWYGRSKRAAEEWLLEQKLPTDKRLIIIRPPMVHGSGDKGNLGLLYKLISKSVPYPLSSFDNKRSFISITNFCFFIQQVIEKYHNLKSGIYHVSDDEPVSTKEIIGIIKEVTGKKGLNIGLPKFLVIAIAKFGDVIPIPLNSKRLKKMTSDLLVSNEKIKKALDIESLPLSAREGLEKTIKSFVQQ